MIKLLNDLSESGTLKKLFRAGLISNKCFLYRNVYNQYDMKIRSGTSHSKAIKECADEFKYSDRYIYDIIKFFEDAKE